MRTDNKLNDEDRLILNNLKMTMGYVITVLAFGLAAAGLLILFLK